MGAIDERPTRRDLEKLYREEELTTREIGGMFGVSKTTILNWMRKYGIPRRNRSEWQSLRLKKLWKDPAYREQMMKHLKEYWSRSEERSLNTRRLWRNPKFKAKMSQIRKNLWKDPEHRAKISRGRKRMWQKPEYRSKMIEERKRRWADPDYKKRVIQKSRKSLVDKPTEPERAVIELIRKYNLPFRYTGDGEVVIDGLNPDFIHNNGKNKVIEVFGRVFHDPEESFFDVRWSHQYWGRILEYKKRGYDCLILWEDEAKEKMLERIKEFA